MGRGVSFVMVMMTTSPGDVDASTLAGRWKPARCRSNKRLFDDNPTDNQIRVWCERCRVNHVYLLDATEDQERGFLN